DVVRFELRSALPLTAFYAVLIGLLTHGPERLALLAAAPWWLLFRGPLGVHGCRAGRRGGRCDGDGVDDLPRGDRPGDARLALARARDAVPRARCNRGPCGTGARRTCTRR